MGCSTYAEWVKDIKFALIQPKHRQAASCWFCFASSTSLPFLTCTTKPVALSLCWRSQDVLWDVQAPGLRALLSWYRWVIQPELPWRFPWLPNSLTGTREREVVRALRSRNGGPECCGWLTAESHYQDSTVRHEFPCLAFKPARGEF